MKLLWVAVFMMLASLAAGQSNLKRAEWLIGTWARTNSKPGYSGFEIWKRISDTEFTGMGVTLRGSDTTFVEKLKIIARNDSILYVADVPGNKGLVYFRLTNSTSVMLSFENPLHDFPKKIDYSLEGTKLRAVVSDGKKVLEYWFDRK